MQPQVAEAMFAATNPGVPARECREREQFRARFKHALGCCLQKGFLLEESFALVWEESLEEILLSPVEQPDLRQELLKWATTQTSPS